GPVARARLIRRLPGRLGRVDGDGRTGPGRRGRAGRGDRGRARGGGLPHGAPAAARVLRAAGADAVRRPPARPLPPARARTGPARDPQRGRRAGHRALTFRSAGTNGPFGRIDYRTAPLSAIFDPFHGAPLIFLPNARKAL